MAPDPSLRPLRTWAKATDARLIISHNQSLRAVTIRSLFSHYSLTTENFPLFPAAKATMMALREWDQAEQAGLHVVIKHYENSTCGINHHQTEANSL